jgi:recombinational DNA repair protein RecR
MTGMIGVEQVEEHEDGSATFQFHLDKECAKLLQEEGLKLVLYCAAAKLDMQVVYDFIEDHIRYENDELQKCVSCGNPSKDDFCDFCLKEE